MSEEKSEKPTGKKLSDAFEKGQFARTPEIQTVFVLFAGLVTLSLTSGYILKIFTGAIHQVWGEMGRVTIGLDSVQAYFTTFLKWVSLTSLPVMAAAVVAGILGSGLQSKFRISFKALELNWDRLNPITNAMQQFQPMQSMARVGIGLLKFLVILGLTYAVVSKLLLHPIFHSATSFGDVLLFMANSAESIGYRVIAGLVLIAGADYAYQWFKHQKSMMMTKEEVKEEAKSTEGNPMVKGELRKRRLALLKQHWLTEIPKADVIVTNPTHLAVALRYDRKTMRAPRVIAKGARLNALRIRELAAQYQIPIVENKPVAQLMFKSCKIGQEIPPQVYMAVAEILAYVYRVNRYRYYIQGQQIPA